MADWLEDLRPAAGACADPVRPVGTSRSPSRSRVTPNCVAAQRPPSTTAAGGARRKEGQIQAGLRAGAGTTSPRPTDRSRRRATCSTPAATSAVGAAMLDGEIAYREGYYERAFAALRRAIATRRRAAPTTSRGAGCTRHAYGRAAARTGPREEGGRRLRRRPRPRPHTEPAVPAPEQRVSLHGYHECLTCRAAPPKRRSSPANWMWPAPAPTSRLSRPAPAGWTCNRRAAAQTDRECESVAQFGTISRRGFTTGAARLFRIATVWSKECRTRWCRRRRWALNR